MSPSTEDIRKRQSARQAAARERIANRNRNRNENTILPRRLDGSPPQPSPPQPSPRKTPPKTPPMRVRDLLKFNAEGKKWKTPEGPRIRKPIDRLTFTRKEASVPEEEVSPMSLALGLVVMMFLITPQLVNVTHVLTMVEYYASEQFKTYVF